MLIPKFAENDQKVSVLEIFCVFQFIFWTEDEILPSQIFFSLKTMHEVEHLRISESFKATQKWT